MDDHYISYMKNKWIFYGLFFDSEGHEQQNTRTSECSVRLKSHPGAGLLFVNASKPSKYVQLSRLRLGESSKWTTTWSRERGNSIGKSSLWSMSCRWVSFSFYIWALPQRDIEKPNGAATFFCEEHQLSVVSKCQTHMVQSKSHLKYGESII